MRFLLLSEQRLKASDLLLHIGVNLKIAGNNLLHLTHVLVNVSVVLSLAPFLQRRNQLAFLSEQLSRFLQVLQMLRPQNVLLLHHIVDFLVESEQIGLVGIVAEQLLASCERLPQIVHFKLFLFWRLHVVHVVLLLFL